MDWPAIFTFIGLFAFYILAGVVCFAPFWLSGDISQHERGEGVDPFPTHGPNNNSKAGTAP